MNIYVEIFGYIGTALVIISMMMTSLTRLRILNISGALISFVYALICSVYPVALLNGALSAINGIQLTKDLIKKRKANDSREIFASKGENYESFS